MTTNYDSYYSILSTCFPSHLLLSVSVLLHVPNYFIAPLGRSAPELPMEDEYVKKGSKIHATIALICSVQASPIPQYR